MSIESDSELKHKLPKIHSSAVSKSPGEIQGIFGVVMNNIAPAGMDCSSIEGKALSSLKIKQFQGNWFKDRQPICIHTLRHNIRELSLP